MKVQIGADACKTTIHTKVHLVQMNAQPYRGASIRTNPELKRNRPIHSFWHGNDPLQPSSVN